MNYMAHAFLSPQQDEILLGNMACDMIHPRDYTQLLPGIREGMNLHHGIDRASDEHKGFKTIRSCLNDESLPYAGVLVDIICDHYLAFYWEEYSREPLISFSQRVYKVLDEKSATLPGYFPRLAFHLRNEDWFGQFKRFEGLEDGLSRLTYRTSRTIPVTDIMNVVARKKNKMVPAFHSLMKSLILQFPPALISKTK